METGVSRGDIELDHYNDHEVGCADPVFHRKIKGIIMFCNCVHYSFIYLHYMGVGRV